MSPRLAHPANPRPALRVRVCRTSQSPHLPWVVVVTSWSPLWGQRIPAGMPWSIATVLAPSFEYAIAYADALAHSAPGDDVRDVALMAKAAADLTVERATERAGAS